MKKVIGRNKKINSNELNSIYTSILQARALIS